MKADIIRFLIAGITNTGLTSLVYLIGAQFAHPSLAYSLAWVLGLIFVTVIYPNKVYVGGRTDSTARAKLALATLTTFLIGLMCLNILLDYTDYVIAYFITLGITTLTNFVVYRFILRGQG